MKRILIFLFALSMFSGAIAQEKLPKNVETFFTKKSEAYFRIFTNSPKEIAVLSRIVSIDNLEQSAVIANANKEEFSRFLEMGLKYEFLPAPGDQIHPLMYDGSKNAYEWDTYPTYDAYVAMMYQFATDYPDLCQVFSIGTTVEGRELLFAKISDNVSQDEAEPQFLYTGTMHGDETTGYVLLLRLIDYFLNNYGTDAEVTDMVDGMEIWINPLANPDGTFHGGNNTVNGSQRRNGNNVDLNRNYKDAQYGDHPDGNAWQPETVAFMTLAEDNNFVMSANFHGGAEVVNYPWDVWSRITADDDWWQMVSHEYADTAQYFSPSSYMNGYNDGITNGYAWYSISGGRQDYMNYFQHCREVTIELSDIKTLPESQLDAHWTYNKRSLINYIKQANFGVRGMVLDSLTHEPLYAKVEVLGHEMDESHVFSREGQGNFHRLLKAGTYDIKFSADGYFPKTFENVVVQDYDSTVLLVELVSASLVSDFSADQTIIPVGGQVQFTQQCFGEPDTYEWTFEGGTPATSTDENPVVTYNEVRSFDVSLTISKGADVQTMTKNNFIRVNEEYLMSNTSVTTCSGLFMDDGGENNYGDNKDYTMTFFSADNSPNAVLSIAFSEFVLEANDNCQYDYLEIYDGPDANGSLIGKFCGTNSPGTVVSSNDEKALTFVFHSDNNVNFSGWKAIVNCTIQEAVHELNPDNVKIYPNPVTNGKLNIHSDMIVNSVFVYNMSGQAVYNKEIMDKNTSLDLSDLKVGMYVLEIKTDKGISHQMINVGR